MKNIQEYLTRFKSLIHNKLFIELCCEGVFKELKLPVSKKDFEVVGGVLKLKTKNPLMRSELRLKKVKVLKEINLKLGKDLLFDIK